MNTHAQGGIYCAHTLIPCLSYSTAFKRNVMSRLAWWLKPCKNFRYFNFLFDSLFVFDPCSIVLSKKKKRSLLELFQRHSIPIYLSSLWCLSLSPSFLPTLPLFLQAWTNVQTTMVAAPTSAGTGESVTSVTVPRGTNSWTKRLVEVKKKSRNKTTALMQKTMTNDQACRQQVRLVPSILLFIFCPALLCLTLWETMRDSLDHQPNDWLSLRCKGNFDVHLWEICFLINSDRKQRQSAVKTSFFNHSMISVLMVSFIPTSILHYRVMFSALWPTCRVVFTDAH